MVNRKYTVQNTTKGHGQFALCTFMRNFKHFILKPMIRIHDDLTETVTTVEGELHKKLYEFDQLKNM